MRVTKNKRLKKLFQTINLENSIIFTGKISPEIIQKYYQMADIFTLPSYTEGLPLVVIEAMACGLPVVVSTVGGIPELVKDGNNGFLVPPKDSFSLNEKLEILVNNEELRKKIGTKALETVDDEFNIDKKVDKMINMYNKLI